MVGVEISTLRTSIREGLEELTEDIQAEDWSELKRAEPLDRRGY